MNARSTKHPLTIFFLLLCLFSSAAYALIIHIHHETAALSRFVMWCPGFAALCTCLSVGIPIRTLGWSWPSARTLRIAYVLPLIYATPVYVLTWVFVRGSFSLKSYEAAMASSYGLGPWPILGTFGVALPLLFTIVVISTMTWALGEELGWRGFLFPRLQERLGFHGACLTSGLIWAVWHYPGLLWADYNAGTNPVYAICCFTVAVTAMGYIMGYLRSRSGSLWPCVLLHATHNTFVEGMFDPLTTPIGAAKYLTSEFGAALAASILIAATWLVQKSALTDETAAIS